MLCYAMLCDRYGRRYWALEPAAATERHAAPVVWVQPRGAGSEAGAGFVGRLPADAATEWECFRGAATVAALAGSLDARGINERALQAAIRQFATARALDHKAAPTT